MIVVPQVLDLFWSAIEREVDKRGRRAGSNACGGRPTAPLRVRRVLFRSIHAQLGGRSGCSSPPARSCRPRSSRPGRTSGSSCCRATAPPRRAPAPRTTLKDHGHGTVGWAPEGIELRIADGGEVQFRGRTVFSGYWKAPELTAQAFTEDGWYRTGDLGHLDDRGRLVLSGRIKDIIVLPNGFNVYPEDLENALRIAGLREAIAVETAPGRIEAIVVNDPREPRPTRSKLVASTRRSRRRTRPLARTSGSPGWRTGPARTSRGRTR